MPDIPEEAMRAAIEAIETRCAQNDGAARWHALVALEAAAPILADKIACAILRYADENEPPAGSGAYLAWHRHFEAASAVAAKAFGRDNPEAPGDH